MTYQPYPTGGGGNQMAERPGQPSSLRTAVRLMWAGAALSLIGVIITLSFSSKIRTAIINAANTANKTAARDHKAQLSAAQIHTLANATFAILVVFGIIGVLLWIWMAWANNKGSSWARIVATVLFALNTIGLIFEVGRASVSLISIVLEWLVGVGAIIMLWRRETTQYISSGRTR
jgi:ABC-type transport system involved in cytochrome bd biosynthesis fused ATPase/permease subunit